MAIFQSHSIVSVSFVSISLVTVWPPIVILKPGAKDLLRDKNKLCDPSVTFHVYTTFGPD